ncbi:MAG: hypothetical protein M9913_12475 [Bryobacteraceae bacterium]|nr:hypothetical protein [Bryobacteraceae bacterium]MCO5351687.1 hypothetical protein [Bryobacteraceae bacterium]HRJ19916.1 hypothetical protein [Bryobacteraceae bacterium]
MDEIAAFAGVMVIFVIVVVLVFAAIVIIPQWRIFQRAGYSGALALLMVLPLVNLIVLLWFAFADWPALKAAQAETPRRFGR